MDYPKAIHVAAQSTNIESFGVMDLLIQNGASLNWIGRNKQSMVQVQHKDHILTASRRDSNHTTNSFAFGLAGRVCFHFILLLVY